MFDWHMLGRIARYEKTIRWLAWDAFWVCLTPQNLLNQSKVYSTKKQHRTIIFWLAGSTHSKHISQIGSFRQIGMNIKNV